MKKIIGFVFFTSWTISLVAQSNYCDTIFIELIKDYKANRLSEALEELKSVELCDYENILTPQRQEWRDSIFRAIEQQKQAAIQAQKAEYKATQQAKAAAAMAQEERKKAILEKENAVQQKNRADSLKTIAEKERQKAEREAAISKAGLKAQLADIANEGGAYEEGFKLAVSAIQLANKNVFEIPIIAYQAFGEAIYKEPDLGYKEIIESTNSNLLYYLPISKDKIFLVYRNNQLAVHDLKNHSSIFKQATGAYLLDFQISSDHSWISISQDNGELLLWNIREDTMITIQAHQQEVLGASFSNNSSFLLTWSREPEAKLWNLEGELMRTFTVGDINKIYKGSFNLQDQHILLRASNWQINVFAIDGTEDLVIPHTSYITYADWLPDGKGVISCSSDGTARLSFFDKTERNLFHSDSPVVKAIFSNSGDFIATVDLKNTIRVWSKQGDLVAAKSINSSLNNFLFVEEEAILFCNTTNIVYKWYFHQDQTIPFLEGHVAEVLSLEQSKNKAFYLSHSLDRTAKLWSQEGRLLMSTNQVIEVPPKLSTDGKKVLSCPDLRQIEATINPSFLVEALK